jgi:uncharacterized protein (TIGR02271 family)
MSNVLKSSADSGLYPLSLLSLGETPWQEPSDALRSSVFSKTPHQADKAVNELVDAGFRQDQIGVALRNAEGAYGTTKTTGAEGSHAESGAVTGAITRLGLGALAGLGVLAGVIPVVGPAIAAGTMGAILSNAAAGASIVGLVGALVGPGIPEHEAEYYHEEFEAGRTIVTVTANERADEATAILRRNGAYDMSTRASPTATTQSAARTTGTSTRATKAREGDTFEVKEERLHVEKRPVKTGEVTVRKEVHTENRTLEVPAEREAVVIERTPVHGRAATIAASDIREGEQIRIPVHEDQVNVTKDAVVTEEVKVGKRTVQDTERVAGQVRKEEVKVEQTGDVDVKVRGKGKG